MGLNGKDTYEQIEQLWKKSLVHLSKYWWDCEIAPG